MKYVVGFAGTRLGMKSKQYGTLRRLVHHLAGEDFIQEAHHGDCFGADEEFHWICDELETPIFVHPPTITRFRAFCKGATSTILPPKEYLERNDDILDVSTLLLTTPDSRFIPHVPSTSRGGTWYMINHAHGRKIPLVVIDNKGRIWQYPAHVLDFLKPTTLEAE